jgi:putative transposase
MMKIDLFCQREKELVIYSWWVMSNHVHIIISAKDNNISRVPGDFKKHTSKQIIRAIKYNPGESRRECLPD